MTGVTVPDRDLVMKTGILHIVAHDKGKSAERRGRKTTGLRDPILGQRGYRSEQGLQVDNNANTQSQGFGPRHCDLYERPEFKSALEA